MPSLFFDLQEVEETKTGKINKSGYLYVGRKHYNKEVIWIKLKELRRSSRKSRGRTASGWAEILDQTCR
jgi:hypothetical protein